jgi:hypothetical protein
MAVKLGSPWLMTKHGSLIILTIPLKPYHPRRPCPTEPLHPCKLRKTLSFVRLGLCTDVQLAVRDTAEPLYLNADAQRIIFDRTKPDDIPKPDDTDDS